jgi:hypothetical protein
VFGVPNSGSESARSRFTTGGREAPITNWIPELINRMWYKKNLSPTHLSLWTRVSTRQTAKIGELVRFKLHEIRFFLRRKGALIRFEG